MQERAVQLDRNSDVAIQAESVQAPQWLMTRSLEEVADMCHEHQRSGTLGDAKSFWMQQREARVGPVGVLDVTFGADLWIDCGEERDTYNITVPLTGGLEALHRGTSISAGPRDVIVYQPHGKALLPRVVGRCLVLRFERPAIEETLAEMLGRQVPSPIDFSPAAPECSAAQGWTELMLTFSRELFRFNGILSQPMVYQPFAESLLRGLLTVADHSHRAAVTAKPYAPTPRALRTAIEILESDAHLPLTMAQLANRSHMSVRSLQYAFRRHLQTTPMAYLRDVRLRRARRDLLDGDPSTDTVTSISYRWGFTNLSRFAAAYTARYGEPPRVTLRRFGDLPWAVSDVEAI